MKENKLYPGRPNYTGPNEGLFGFVHHSDLFDPSRYIDERVRVIKDCKPRWQRGVRLYSLVYLPTDRLPMDVAEVISRFLNFRILSDDVYWHVKENHKDLVEALVLELVPDAPWNGKELDFSKPWAYKVPFLRKYLRRK